ncbi:PH domain-containing protein [Paraliobacillus sp. X-1268]|uniref:PH domain-containing protein n=1 Tax=Paraliobacillus sp. X-1268 TaxID=2213193 RepID=UPI001E3FC605|nr:PH domain-containing protein [Paraliobacillus sp. X-1268]
MSEAKRLHPAAIIFRAINTIRQSIFGLLPIILIASNDGFFKYVILGVIVLTIVFIVLNVIGWMKFTYQLDEDQLRIEQGIFIRKKRTISKNRIQSIDLSQNIIHRIFGLTKVQIETAGSDQDVDAALSAVTFTEGQWLHDQLKAKRPTATNSEEKLVEEDTKPEGDYPSRTISFRKLFIAGSTSGSFGIILALLAFLSSQVETLIPDKFYQETTTWLISQAIETIVLLSILFFIGVWLVGILGTMIKYGNFTITRYEEELYITRGLLEKKQTTIPLKRIQAVGITQSIIRQPLGLATIFVEIAGGETDKQEGTNTILFPLLGKNKIHDFLDEIIPEYSNLPENYTPLPKRALPYYLLRSIWIPLLASIAVGIFFIDWIWIPLIVLALSILLGILTHRTTGFKLTESMLTLQMRQLSKETIMLKQKRIQAFEKKQHILHRKQGLATLKGSILNNFFGRDYILAELEEEDVDRIADWYSYNNDLKKPTN